jgi:NAD(P)-dependent dehydrogenase (short-subunit alcohol dehydrogenase family)
MRAVTAIVTGEGGYVEHTPDYPKLMRLDGRHVLVLGGGQGIGRQTCLGAAALGAKVSCVDVQLDRAKQVAEEAGGQALTGDATSRAEMTQIFSDAVAGFGPPNAVIDIIGAAPWGPLRELDDEVWQQGFDMNIKHAFLAMQIGSRYMPDGGSMVFTASISGFRSSPNHASYGAGKAGLINLVGTASLELAPIRVNAVAPGQTLTPRMAVRHAGEENYYEERAQQVPLHRIGQPSDIASALLFFASDLSAWITGQTLVVDGGAGRKYQYDV